MTGGSQGSGLLNAAIADYARDHIDDAGLAIRHVVGERFVAGTAATAPSADGLVHQIVGYEDRMDLVYAAADVLVGRGGASTVAEVAVTGIPAVLVPWAAAADDHQTLNVRWLAGQDAAVLLAERDRLELAATVESLRTDPVRLAGIGERARVAGDPSRRGMVAALVERTALA